MSPRAAWRLETLGFKQVYDYVDGKKDWFEAGLRLEGTVEKATWLGDRVRREVPVGRMADTVGELAARAHAAGWDEAVITNEAGTVLGWLGAESLSESPSGRAEDAMLEGPVTFRPSKTLGETAAWMDENRINSVLVTSPDGALIGVARRADLD
ncbi:MAG: hypothetical protein NVS9B1_24780 [Candidatus Dormibacteraceae bacterium]